MKAEKLLKPYGIELSYERRGRVCKEAFWYSTDATRNTALYMFSGRDPGTIVPRKGRFVCVTAIN